MIATTVVNAAATYTTGPGIARQCNDEEGREVGKPVLAALLPSLVTLWCRIRAVP